MKQLGSVLRRADVPATPEAQKYTEILSKTNEKKGFWAPFR